jgi:hypothetical protein
MDNHNVTIRTLHDPTPGKIRHWGDWVDMATLMFSFSGPGHNRVNCGERRTIELNVEVLWAGN